MLVSIDILLGLSEVMLLTSMVVTVLAHFVTNALNSRGRHLLYGLAHLLQQVDPDIQEETARHIAGTLLMHPMIRDGMRRYGSTIHREEFTRLLMDLASGNAPKEILERLGSETQKRLIALLEKNGVTDPKTVLENARLLALQLEIDKPELAANIRHSMALLQVAKGPLIAKINAWFDQTIDRVGGRFTVSTRIITVACSLVVACAIQLDTIQLINRFSIDTELRNSLVQQAVEMGERMENTPATLNQLSGQNKEDIKQLLQLGIITVPKTLEEWQQNWDSVSPLGIAFTAMLLSLGAPFWYNVLKNLLKLRSNLARQDDLQRKERQTTQLIDENPADRKVVLLGPLPSAGGDSS
ncbi:MAG: hypothetical protein ACR65R_10055 [Methylomicrobium sp.]